MAISGYVVQDRRLLQGFGQRVPVVRIARHRACAYHQAFPSCREAMCMEFGERLLNEHFLQRGI
ncbi:hypothetical protein WL48_04755 [Burkholderia ubonensis]|nr:hypothetical protein WL48_04755 [Burkholderia ubonensis]KWC29097.1 hypothetical protein WL49_29940 [Burkholderia ubonensis]KWO02583.1 hypothetical protein WM25_20910 [Burkholderia ubonensis]